MKKEKKVINHKFLDKHTIPGVILLMVWGLLFSEGIFPLPFSLICAFFVELQQSSTEIIQLITYLFSIFGAFFVLAIHKRWFYPEFDGCLSGGFQKTVCAAAAIIPFWIITVIKEIVVGSKFQPISLEILIISLMAGCCEEAAFRGLGVSYLMRQWKEENKIPAVILITSAAFGLVHGANIFTGAAFGITLIQVLSAGCIGVFFCAVFLRGGNLLPVMLIHTIEDILAGIFTAEGYTLTHAVSVGDIIDLLLCIVLAFVGLWLVRKEKRAEIVELWTRKWSGTVDIAQQTAAGL